MNELEIGDRVKVIFAPALGGISNVKIINGMTGTVKALQNGYIGVEFDDDIGGNTGSWNGKDGHCYFMNHGTVAKIKESEVKE